MLVRKCGSNGSRTRNWYRDTGWNGC